MIKGHNLKRSSDNLTEAISQHLQGKTEKAMKNLLGQSMPQPTPNPNTYHTKVESTTMS
jgi:hypothetical protein